MNRIDYFLNCKRIGYKFYLLTIEERDKVVYERTFSTGQELELYMNLFEMIRSENKLYNQVAFLHIPDYWYDNDYRNLLEAFNYNHDSVKTNRDGITLLN
jgi:hypothetical protein